MSTTTVLEQVDANDATRSTFVRTSDNFNTSTVSLTLWDIARFAAIQSRTNSVSKNISAFRMPFIQDDHLAPKMETSSQDQSSFFARLPGEIRNQIYELAMTSSRPVIDPSLPPTHTPFAKAMYYRTEHHRVPDLSTQLLRTCKRMHQEISLTSLYSRNVFRFTTWFSAHRFLSALPTEHRSMVENIEVDLRGINDNHPAAEREWVQYLTWTAPDSSLETIWTTKISRLPLVAPNIKTLRLNIEAWRVQETMRSIALLREILAGPRDLERIVMTGVDGSELLFGSRQSYLEKWGPVAFVGVMRFARLAGMVDWMAACVRGGRMDSEEERKLVVMWEKVDRRVSLVIMTREEYKVQTGKRASRLIEEPIFDLEKGECMLEQYETRWHSGAWPNDAGN